VKGLPVMVDNSHLLKVLKERLDRVKKGEVWSSDQPGPYSSEEKAAEIARIKALIARIEAGDG
jgi:hypothetical protein